MHPDAAAFVLVLAGGASRGWRTKPLLKAHEDLTSSVHFTSCYVLLFSVCSTQLESDTSSTIPAEVHGAGLAHTGRRRIPAALIASAAMDPGKAFIALTSHVQDAIEVAASAAASAGVHGAVLVHNASLAPQGMHRSLMSKMK